MPYSVVGTTGPIAGAGVSLITSSTIDTDSRCDPARMARRSGWRKTPLRGWPSPASSGWPCRAVMKPPPAPPPPPIPRPPPSTLKEHRPISASAIGMWIVRTRVSWTYAFLVNRFYMGTARYFKDLAPSPRRPRPAIRVPPPRRSSGADGIEIAGFQAGAADQRAVDIRHREDRVGIVGLHRAALGLARSTCRDRRARRGWRHASKRSRRRPPPFRFRWPRPVRRPASDGPRRCLRGRPVELCGHHGLGGADFPLAGRLADADHHRQTFRKRRRRLCSDRPSLSACASRRSE